MRSFFIIFTFLVMTLQSLAAVTTPLYPEDGSLRMTHWFYSKNTHFDTTELQQIKSALYSEGVKPVILDFPASYLQDVILFDEEGSVLIQAPMPVEPENILSALTIAVLDFDRLLTKIEPDMAATLGFGSRQMDWTFVEGGGFISGKFTDGEDYVLLTSVVLDRAMNFYEYLNSQKIPKEKIKELIARDLNVKEENLFVLPMSGHLDLEIMALPGGVLLMNDQTRVIETLDHVLANYPASDAEKKTLKQMRELYSEGFQRYYNNGDPMGPRQFPAGLETHRLNSLEQSALILQKRFTVIRLAGRISTLDTYANSSDLTLYDNINFFNAFLGKNDRGELFVMTNMAPRLPVLETYWRDVLKNQGVSPEHVHFVGRYSFGAGLDCKGAGANLSGR